MTATYQSSVVTNSLTSGGQLEAPITLPSSLSGHVGRIQWEWNDNATDIATPPADWEQVGPTVAHPSVAILKVAHFRKALTATDDASIPTLTFTTGRRWSAGFMAFAEGRDADITPAPTVTTASANVNIGASTTATAESVVAAMVSLTLQEGAVTGLTAPSGWTLRRETYTTNQLGLKHGTALFTRDALLASGSASSAAVATTAGGLTNALTYTYLVSPALGVTDEQGWAYGLVPMATA